MNIRRKAAAVAGSAVLLASIFSVAVAPAAFAAAPLVTSAGVVPVNGTSTGTASFNFAESVANCFSASATAFTVQILDSALAPTLTFSGTPVVSAPSSLGATASIAGNRLTIGFAGASPSLPLEQVTVSGLHITAAAAALGAINTQLIAPSVDASCVFPSTVTASGTLLIPMLPGSTVAVISIPAGGCPFALSSATGTPAIFATTAESHNVVLPLNAAVPAYPAAGTQVVNVAAVTGNQGFGEPITQLGVPNCAPILPQTIGSVGTVASALTQSTTNTVILPGEFNQVGGTETLDESPSGTGTDFTAGEIVTFTITAPTTGVVFSGPEIATPAAHGGGAGLLDLGAGINNPVPCSLNITRTACSVVVVSDGAGFDQITLSGPGLGINFDVAAGTPLGTAVNVNATTSTGYAVNVSSSTVAFVGRTVVGVSSQPTIYIGQNKQQTGLITLQESGAGFFVAGLSGNNTFAICLATGEIWTFAPFAVVTVAGGTPGLQLEVGSPATPASTAQGTLYAAGNCAFWTVYSPSTTGPGTIEIRGSADGITPLPTGPNNGPTVNVPAALHPGSTQMAILIGTGLGTAGGCGLFPLPACATATGFNSLVSNAIRAFQNSVLVAAVSQPMVAPGTASGLTGNVTVTETQNGQLKPGDTIVFQYLPRATTTRNDLIIEPGNTNALPIVNTNVASGLLVSPIIVICPATALLGITFCAFTTTITQQSFGPAFGQITVSNINVQVAPDAILGPENLRVTNTGILGFGVPAGQPFDSVISNVTIGNTPPPPAATKVQAESAVTKTVTASAFSVSTKVITLAAHSNNIVTIRFQMSPALQGQIIQVWVAKKSSSGVWGAWKEISGRRVGSDGYAYFYMSSTTAQWLSFRGMFNGNASWAASHSQTVQVRWK